MKITYTSDDVKHWDTEAECLGRESFQALLEADRYVHEPGDDPEDGTDFDSALDWFVPIWESKQHTFLVHNLWTERRHLYRVVNLLKRAEAGV